MSKTYLDAVQMEPDFTGKWSSFYTQGPRSISGQDTTGVASATVIVAASDSLHKEDADYVCDGVRDYLTITEAIWGFIITTGDPPVPDAASMLAEGMPSPRRVVLLEGTYMLDEHGAFILLSSGCTVEGQGPSTVMRICGNVHSYGFCTVGSISGLSGTYTEDVTLKNFKYTPTPDGDDYRTFDGFRLWYAASVHIENIDMYYGDYLWINCQFTDKVTIKNCLFHDIQGYAMYLDNTEDVLIEGCRIYVNKWFTDWYVLFADWGDNIDFTVRNCIFQPIDPSEYFKGAIGVDCTGTAIVENCIIHNFDPPIHVAGDGVSIVRNNVTVYKNEAGGVHRAFTEIRDTGLTQVTNNTFIQTEVIIWPENAFVTNNIFRSYGSGDQQYAVTASDGVLINGNDCYGLNLTQREFLVGASYSFGAGNRMSDGSWVVGTGE